MQPQTIDITKLSLIEIKALCYDKHALLEKLAVDIQKLEAEIQKRTTIIKDQPIPECKA